MPPPEPLDRYCPSCGGAFMQDHPGGALECLHSNTCVLLNAEDGTRAADHDRASRSGIRRFRRSSTAAERALMTVLDGAASGTITVVYLSPTVRRRTWATPTTT